MSPLKTKSIEQVIEEDSDNHPSSSRSLDTSDHGNYEDCRSICVARALNIVCIALYGYAIYFQNMDSKYNQ